MGKNDDVNQTGNAEGPESFAGEMDLKNYSKYVKQRFQTAVFELSKKGYAVSQSYFDNEMGNQAVSFQENYLKGYALPQKLVSELANKGIAITSDDSSIKMHFDHFSDVEETKHAWDLVVETLPGVK